MTKGAWIAIAVAILIALLFAWLWHQERSASALAKRDAAGERDRAAGLIVANQKLKLDLKDALEGKEILQRMLDRALAVEPESKPTSTVSASTGPLPVVGVDECMLRVGDALDVRTDQITLETKEGNSLLVGQASCWRVKPEPPFKLAEGELKANVTTFNVIDEAKTEKKFGWGAGAFLGAGKDGWVAGPAVSPPPIQVLGTQGELTVGFGVGPNSAWQLGGVGLLRW